MGDPKKSTVVVVATLVAIAILFDDYLDENTFASTGLGVGAAALVGSKTTVGVGVAAAGKRALLQAVVGILRRVGGSFLVSLLANYALEGMRAQRSPQMAEIEKLKRSMGRLEALSARARQRGAGPGAEAGEEGAVEGQLEELRRLVGGLEQQLRALEAEQGAAEAVLRGAAAAPPPGEEGEGAGPVVELREKVAGLYERHEAAVRLFEERMREVQRQQERLSSRIARVGSELSLFALASQLPGVGASGPSGAAALLEELGLEDGSLLALLLKFQSDPGATRAALARALPPAAAAACVAALEGYAARVEPASQLELVFDRDGASEALRAALREGRERVLLVCPWVTTSAVTRRLLRDVRAFLDRNPAATLDVGFGYPRDWPPEALPDAEKWKYAGLFELLEALGPAYGPRLRVKGLATHEKYLCCDSRFALIGSHNFLSSRPQPQGAGPGGGGSASGAGAAREVGVRTTDGALIADLVARFDGDAGLPDWRPDAFLHAYRAWRASPSAPAPAPSLSSPSSSSPRPSRSALPAAPSGPAPASPPRKGRPAPRKPAPAPPPSLRPVEPSPSLQGTRHRRLTGAAKAPGGPLRRADGRLAGRGGDA
eukprot:tig00020961_g16683.t1